LSLLRLPEHSLLEFFLALPRLVELTLSLCLGLWTSSSHKENALSEYRNFAVSSPCHPSLADTHYSAIPLGEIQPVDGNLSFFAAGHLDQPKALAQPAAGISHDPGGRDDSTSTEHG